MVKNKNKIIFFSKKTKVVVILGVSVLLLLVVTGYALNNIHSKPTKQVEQQDNISLPDISDNDSGTKNPEILLSGQFQDGDAVHSGTGDVSVVNSMDGALLVFDDNFKVTNGPDLLVYLSPNSSGESLGDFVSLGKLKSGSGAQAYNLPINYSEYKTVVVWCRAFSVTFATAELK